MKNKSIIRSPLFYVGDKSKIITEISRFFPHDISNFVEPFVGGGSVFLNSSAEHFILNDIDKKVIGIHKMLCSYKSTPKIFFDVCFSLITKYGLSCSAKNIVVPNELKNKFHKTYYAVYNKKAYLDLRNDYNLSNGSDFILLYLLLIYGFNHMIRFNSNGDFNLPVGNVDFNSNVVSSLYSYFDEVQKKSISWLSLDFKSFFNKIKLSERDFVYLDPPYLITFSEYNKLWSEKEDRDLLLILDSLHKRGIRFAISNVTHYKGKENSLFIEWASKYHSHEIKSNYISYHDNTIKNFQEVLVTNY